MNYIGIDVGGTKIYGAKFSDNFEILDSIKIQTNANLGKDSLIKHIIEVIGKLKNDQTNGIGISWAGFVDSDQKTINISPNIDQFEQINLGKIIEEWFNLPVIIENDSRCFSIAEQQLNLPKIKNLLGITFGTGIGSGIISNGNPLFGTQNYAGEIGHHILAGKEAEKLFAGPALKKLFKKDLNSVIKMQKSKIRKKLTKEIKLLANWLFNISLTLNPEIIIFGGWVGKNFWSLFIPDIEKEIIKISNKYKIPIKVKIKISSLENAGSLGVAILIRNKFQ